MLDLTWDLFRYAISVKINNIVISLDTRVRSIVNETIINISM
jgi:hypothetical protein